MLRIPLPGSSSALQALLHPADPQRPALSDGTTKIGYGELATRIAELAQRLRELRPHALGLLLDNGIEWIVADLAAQAAAIPVVPLPAFFSAAQTASVLAAAGVDALIAGDVQTATGLGFTPAGGLARLFARTDARRLPLPRGTAKITFTSGTTGQPKGVCLSAEQQWRLAQSLIDATAEAGIERHLCLLPLPVLLENVAGVYAPLAAGAEVIAPPLAAVGMPGAARLDLHRMLGAIAEHEPHSVILLPQMLKAWVAALAQGAAALPEGLRFVAVGGGKVGADLIRHGRELGLPVHEGYGLSECASVVSLNTPRADRIGAVGRVLPHVRVRLADDGEILVSGNTFLGYLGAPEGPPAEVATGDLGRLDENGFLTIEGRKKNVLITAFGRNVSPEWPEAELLGQPAILQAAVFGEARPSCCAVLVAARAEIDDAALQAAVDAANRELPDYARISVWVRAPDPFSLGNGLATANGRPRRDAVWARFGGALDALYQHLEESA